MNNVFSDDFKEQFMKAYGDFANQLKFIISYHVFLGILSGKDRDEIERDIIDFFKKYNEKYPDSWISFILEDEDAKQC